MRPFHPFAARSRAARASSLPKTPEPLAGNESAPPSPPRPRFRLKRRNASNLNAPTQQFLASVAAADVPIPSIEEPHVLDEDMLDTLHPALPHLGHLEALGFTPQGARERLFSPPKTPAPGVVPPLSPRRYPDWSMDSMSSWESSPECESSRPSTARSTQTSASLFSNFSVTSDELSRCLSPEMDTVDHLAASVPGNTEKTIKAPASNRQRKAPWTRAMSQHVWSTYLMYLQDPKVTPFRVGKSGIPPHGVCLRVAREAKRSWKGSNPHLKPNHKSGSTTPTVEPSGSFVQWPHTCAGTRAHLRELCKANASTAARNHQYLAHSPTPFGKTASRFRNRRSTPARSPSVFSGSDMAMSLTVCTAESMQMQGPLAQLTRSLPEPRLEQPASVADVTPAADPFAPEPQRIRLGSPFMARSYGPSSSTSLAATLGLGSEAPRQAQTIGHQYGLRSPARVTRSRSNTQKRRDRPPLFEPRRIKRPSIGSDLWTDPSVDDVPATTALAEFSSTASNQRDNLFVPRTNIQELFETTQLPSLGVKNIRTNQQHLAAPLGAPARLGSPFAFASASLSVPNRFSSPAAAISQDAVRKPFATVQQPAENTTTTPKSSLASRLAYIDERLRDFRRRDQTRRRSDSPL